MKICFSKGEHFFSTLYTLQSKESLMWTVILRGNNCYSVHMNKTWHSVTSLPRSFSTCVMQNNFRYEIVSYLKIWIFLLFIREILMKLYMLSVYCKQTHGHLNNTVLWRHKTVVAICNISESGYWSYVCFKINRKG